jgi:hypothetical protein
MVELGDCATVMGGYFLHVAASGTLEAATPEPIAIGRTAGIMDAMDWVQPVLGQAIVDDYLLGREASSRTIAAAAEFNRATMIGHRLRSLPLMPFEGIRASAAEAEADHAARVQFVLGGGHNHVNMGSLGLLGNRGRSVCTACHLLHLHGDPLLQGEKETHGRERQFPGAARGAGYYLQQARRPGLTSP